MMSFDEDQTKVSPEGTLVMNSYSNRFSLPKNWPQNVKAAVLHIVSLAHVAMIHARGLVVHSSDSPTRRAGVLVHRFLRYARRHVSPCRQSCYAGLRCSLEAV